MTEYSDDLSAHPEAPHMINRSNWLRAAVLGANDGIVSVSALVVGVAAADPSPRAVLIAGTAGLAAGAMSMAAGEYVSVSSQSDIERADIEREREALVRMPKQELEELAAIYRSRGMSPATAMAAREVTEHDALGAHVREELGISDVNSANPLQAAFASGVTFSVAASLPVLAAFLAPAGRIIPWVLAVTLLALALLGAVGARAGGAPTGRATARVVVWGIFAMAITMGVGRLFGVAA
ncbi:MAG TPA: VIT family protein [Paracoccus sp. (in: a-proteobacteria)]|nr:VIT family protein [Paracoccus sp. (in: a-proteobacteria)]